ncbi:FAD/FMN-containing dehydrogenase/Fe-S oxidoreductase [Saccharothrix ecbatanensis]|uniref:FAD/FMN-containing dehydrogenase/Fe-S oxidoreductase n=1 Tax=Saccharothrix ecbatanensis TaxID=1105145 RepID=A0A7W9HKS3_9PSEU|nr:FAD-binding and (Fe-S)-binding domain-containing protein [Saccharothrix ecbatanensis]MBB5804107.1 FAD/FMN-containing dehydrogenase/Fe-S oxidoreductase [Saccharothrix ecbatanensis]
MTGFVEQLRTAVDGDVLADPADRALYSVDASNYRHVPSVVVRPRTVDAVVAAVGVAAEHGVPITNRGAGTSIAGNSAGAGMVIDFSRYLDQVISVDPVERLAVVRPGVVLDRLNDAARPHGLIFGPDPSTHSRCTLGGMIGNDACGAHSVAWGKTSDNVRALDVLLADGRRFDTRTPPPLDLPDVDPTWFPALDRRVSGYRLDALPDLTRALVGSEGTCVTVLGATLRLVEAPTRRVLAVLGFDGPYDAADLAPALRELDVLTIEGLNAELARAAGDSRRLLPRGESWLFVETSEDVVAHAAAALAPHSVVVTDPGRQRALWRVREDGAGLATRMADGGEAWSGWEDAAVPPERLGAYLREFDALLAGHGRRGVTYGHYGEGCLHVRIDFDFKQGYRSFVEDAADLVVAHGGSLSGEHGDGQARSELLPRMYPPAAIRAFGRFKAAFDPDDRMNPGRIVAPLKLDADLRVLVAPPVIPTRAALALHADGGDFAAATRRCVGVGKCLNTSGGVMCPSYRVTREEKHSTRGRARLLFEMLGGQVVRGGWRSEEVRDALDLCLGCKGCKRDCPVDVDMATYKAEFLHHHYRRRVRPAAHYSMGWLPLWLRLRLVNRVSARFARFGGVATERPLPVPVRSFQSRFAAVGGGDRVLLFPDTFTNYFEPGIGFDAAAVLGHVGQGVEVPSGAVCCGLTWFSTGQLGVARRVVRRTARVLRPWTRDGVPVVGLEPSCTAFLRSDALEVAGDDPDVVRLAESVRTFAEHVSPLLEPLPEVLPEVLPGADQAVVQPHCHQYAEMGLDADRELLTKAGVTASLLEGCCGLAGNFGFERGHYDVSMAVGEETLFPAVRAAHADTAIVADGFSCRTQVRHGSSADPVHTATLIRQRLGLHTP